MTSTAMDEDEFPSLAKVWERLEGEDNHFLGSIDRCSAATLKGLLRAVQRMQFHLQKPCIVRVGSELDFVAFADIQRATPYHSLQQRLRQWWPATSTTEHYAPGVVPA